jgi:methylaspartate mutase sigma subunit
MTELGLEPSGVDAPALALAPPADVAGCRGLALVSSTASDAHTWNLVYLQLLMEELGFRVVNLGACVPEEMLVESALAERPDLVVISSVNGHGYQDGLRLAARLRAEPGLEHLPLAIGGKLGVDGAQLPERIRDLLESGFDAVFDDGAADGPTAFAGYLARISPRTTGELR